MGRKLGGRNRRNAYEVIYTQNQHAAERKVFRVVSGGLVWLVRTNEDGSESVVDELFSGEYFGQEALFTGV